MSAFHNNESEPTEITVHIFDAKVEEIKHNNKIFKSLVMEGIIYYDKLPYAFDAAAIHSSEVQLPHTKSFVDISKTISATAKNIIVTKENETSLFTSMSDSLRILVGKDVMQDVKLDNCSWVHMRCQENFLTELYHKKQKLLKEIYHNIMYISSQYESFKNTFENDSNFFNDKNTFISHNLKDNPSLKLFETLEEIEKIYIDILLQHRIDNDEYIRIIKENLASNNNSINDNSINGGMGLNLLLTAAAALLAMSVSATTNPNNGIAPIAPIKGITEDLTKVSVKSSFWHTGDTLDGIEGLKDQNTKHAAAIAEIAKFVDTTHPAFDEPRIMLEKAMNIEANTVSFAGLLRLSGELNIENIKHYTSEETQIRKKAPMGMNFMPILRKSYDQAHNDKQEGLKREARDILIKHQIEKYGRADYTDGQYEPFMLLDKMISFKTTGIEKFDANVPFFLSNEAARWTYTEYVLDDADKEAIINLYCQYQINSKIYLEFKDKVLPELTEHVEGQLYSDTITIDTMTKDLEKNIADLKTIAEGLKAIKRSFSLDLSGESGKSYFQLIANKLEAHITIFSKLENLENAFNKESNKRNKHQWESWSDNLKTGLDAITSNIWLLVISGIGASTGVAFLFSWLVALCYTAPTAGVESSKVIQQGLFGLISNSFKNTTELGGTLLYHLLKFTAYKIIKFSPIDNSSAEDTTIIESNDTNILKKFPPDLGMNMVVKNENKLLKNKIVSEMKTVSSMVKLFKTSTLANIEKCKKVKCPMNDLINAIKSDIKQKINNDSKIINPKENNIQIINTYVDYFIRKTPFMYITIEDKKKYVEYCLECGYIINEFIIKNATKENKIASLKATMKDLLTNKSTQDQLKPYYPRSITFADDKPLDPESYNNKIRTVKTSLINILQNDELFVNALHTVEHIFKTFTINKENTMITLNTKGGNKTYKKKNRHLRFKSNKIHKKNTNTSVRKLRKPIRKSRKH